MLFFSLIFYGWGEPRYVIIMSAAIILSFFFGLMIEKFQDKPISKVFLAFSAVISLGMLAYYKYADFFISNFNAATGMSLPLLKIALPIGISFYTFQILSYTVDVYRKQVPAQRNIINLAAYVTSFPQLIAGPIVRYSDVALQLENRTHSFDKAAEGIRRFVLGISKKILIANQLGELCDIFRASTEQSVLFYWIYGISFTLHIYFDFSGYSDMAIGLGKFFGFDFMENFNYPFISKSISEFWRRWHISLSTWFRDYLYIPLGGNRVSKKRWVLNVLIVWFATGFWHGASWNFIVWGLYFAFFLLFERFVLSKHLDKLGFFRHFYVMFFIIISFVIFNAPDMKQAMADIGGMLGMNGLPLTTAETFYYLRSYGMTFIIAILGSTPLVKTLLGSMAKSATGEKIRNVLETLVLILLLLVCTAYLVDGSFNPFLYFRF